MLRGIALKYVQVLLIVFFLFGCEENGPSEPENYAPAIPGMTANPPELTVFGSMVGISRIIITAADADGDSLTWDLSSPQGELFDMYIYDDGNRCAIKYHPPSFPGTYYVTCKIKDGFHTTTKMVSVTVIRP